MLDSFDLQQLARATDIPIRRLRYVLEHRVLPGSQRHSQGHRITRHFTPLEAFGIASAALMLRSGLRRDLVATVMDVMGTKRGGAAGREALWIRAFSGTGPVDLEIADGNRLRLQVKGFYRPVDSGWLALEKGVPLERLAEPTLVILVHLARIRDSLRGFRA